MLIRRLRVIRVTAAATVLAGMMLGSAASAQTKTGGTVRVVRRTVVLEQPRGDSIRVGFVQPGDVLEVLERHDNWVLVVAPTPKSGKSTWDRGWIHIDAVELASVGTVVSASRPKGRLMIRGFGQAGGTLFAANDSFDTILGGSFGPQFGGGGQVVFPNGAFAQVAVDRFDETGTRALVSGTQIFTLDLPEKITVTPITISAGYRGARTVGLTPYVGAGVGWHRLEEESLTLSTERISSGHIGYHVLGGAEYALLPWVWVAGEVQWSIVPNALGESGVSSVFEEDDLGGTTFRFKLIFGR